jgi:hypothetical protein
MEKNKIEDAKQLGFIARMNQLSRIPLHDKKMQWVWKEKTPKPLTAQSEANGRTFQFSFIYSYF